MEIRLLGPVEVSVGQQIARSIPTQQRLVLAVLAVNVGKPITAESLITRVWDHAPPGARRTLYVLITRVRRLLETASRTVQTPPALVRSSSGYLLRTNPHSIDVQRFKYLVDRASEPNQNHDHRAGLLRSAIGLWREEPLAGLPGDWTARTRAGWKREYLDAVVSWASAELRIGNVSAIVGPLTKLTGEYPLVEPLVAALMRALVATGQSATALDQYQAAKQRLAEGLGVDPGPELRNLNQAILRGELDHTYAVTEALTILAGGPPPQPAAAAVPVVPAQLPAGITGFAGRHEQLARLDALLLTNEREAPSAAVIAAVSGTAGVGKTTIAVHWAHRMADRFPDGQLYVNLCGFDRQERLSPEQAVRGFLDALGVPPERIPRDPHTQTALYRSLIAGKRMMLLIDNARDSDQVRPLLPGTPTLWSL
jgi:DNA-binding SARP family transcriptional activator